MENKLKIIIATIEKILFIILFINGIVQSFVHNYLCLVVIEVILFFILFIFFKLNKKYFFSITINMLSECFKSLNYALCHIIATLGIICFINLDKITLSIITIIVSNCLMSLSRKLNPLRFL